MWALGRGWVEMVDFSNNVLVVREQYAHSRASPRHEARRRDGNVLLLGAGCRTCVCMFVCALDTVGLRTHVGDNEDVRFHPSQSV